MRHLRRLAAGLLLVAIAAGCERKEKLLDIETPDGGIEIERDKQTDEIDVEIDK